MSMFKLFTFFVILLNVVAVVGSVTMFTIDRQWYHLATAFFCACFVWMILERVDA